MTVQKPQRFFSGVKGILKGVLLLALSGVVLTAATFGVMSFFDTQTEPVEATATSMATTGNTITATGLLDARSGLEGYFALDTLTGELRMLSLSQASRKFMVMASRKTIMQDFKVTAGQEPRFLMVTGLANLTNQGGKQQLASCVVYITEIKTGRVMAYGVVWNVMYAKPVRPITTEIIPLDGALSRTQAGGAPL